MKFSLASIVCIWIWGCWSTADGQSVEQLEQEAMYMAAEQAASFVVKIETIGGADTVGNQLVSSAPTSGVVLESSGYIVGSAYAFSQNPNSILVQLPDGQRKSAKIVSRDHRYGLVLLKVEVDQPLATPPNVADSGDVKVGQWAITVGRTFAGDQFNMSVGIVSAKQRVWGKAIQIDANVSPANYGGALTDIQGQLVGILVPMSPTSSDVNAGTEWYDSGIGFAIPMDRIMEQLGRWKEGDIHAGKMGIAMKSESLYTDAPVIGVCRPKSPARDADMRPGDTIVSANGIAVQNYAQLKHLLGNLAAGQSLTIEVERNGEALRKELKLVDKLEPYKHAFLGVLPATSQEQITGLVVRHVFLDSPAERAGMQRKDQLKAVDDIVIQDEQGLRETLAALEPGQEVELQWERNGEAFRETVALEGLSETVPDQVPARFAEIEAIAEAVVPLGKIDIKLPEEVNDCVAYIPEMYDQRFAHGLLVLLPMSDEKDVDNLVREWRATCNATRTILLIPQARDERGWGPSESTFIRKTIENLRNDYQVDADRIVLCGQGSSGSMAYLTAFKFRDLVRGVAAVNAVIPSQSPGIFNEPLQRLSFWIASPSEGKIVQRIEGNRKLLRRLQFPVSSAKTAAETINDDIREEIVRWMDTLDRL